jgi:hypothetical protein
MTNSTISQFDEASAAAQTWGVPFPSGIQTWYADELWNVVPSELRKSSLMWRAKKSLATVFDDPWLRAQTFQSHPISIQSRFRYNRWGLFRLGVACDILKPSSRIREKLRIAREYIPCAAELDFGLFLRCTGAKVQHEPLAPSKGPDFDANWGAQPVPFEVKCIQFSDTFKQVEHAACTLSMKFSGMACSLTHLSGWALQLHVDEAALTSAAKDEEFLDAMLAGLATTLRDWATDPSAGEFPLRTAVRFRAKRWDVPGVNVGGPAVGGNARHEAFRLRTHLLDAADQLVQTRRPGFIVLSQERHSLLRNHVDALVRLMRDEQSLRHVAGIVFYDVELDDIRRRLIPNVLTYTRREHRRLLPSLSQLRLGGRVSVRPL